MNFIEQHKAALITILLTGIIVLAMFSFHITKHSKLISENYYEMEPQDSEELKKLEALKALEKIVSQTNQAYNQDKEFEEMMKNFKSISSDDFKRTTKAIEKKAAETADEIITSTLSNNSSNDYSINKDERASFKKANAVLTKHLSKKNEKPTNSKANSSVFYSLVNRDKVYLPPPVYLCEVNGKVVVNITVNTNGDVINTYINSSSTTNNQCLIDHALEYAKSARFTSDASKTSQIGSITYFFKGKN